ncbi:MAG: hypothetical protein FJ189_03790 [Gammaproteobacteria bacterium]|nr:hypothetical protein [Gammaproteobacteria bacterium]
MALLQQDAATPGVQIRDALSGALVRDIPFSSGHAGIGFSVIADLNANSARELALLSDTKGPAIAHQIEIRDSSTGELIHTLNFPAGQRVRSLFKLPDLNENDSHELVTLHPELHEFGVMDSQTGAELNSIETALTEPLFTGTQTSIGSGTRLAVLGRSDPDGQIRAEVYNSLTSAIVNTIAFDQSGVTVSFRAIPDINGNGSSELVRLRAQAGPPALVAEIRDGGTGELLNTIGF